MSFQKFSIVSLLLVLLAFPLSLYGQGTTSRVTGIVEDNTGALVAGATVTLTNEATGFSLTTETKSRSKSPFRIP